MNHYEPHKRKVPYKAKGAENFLKKLSVALRKLGTGEYLPLCDFVQDWLEKDHLC